LEASEHDPQSEDLDEEEECEADSRSCDIWEDVNCLELLQGRVLPDTVDHLESKRARKRMLNYHWQGQSLYFKGLLVPRPVGRLYFRSMSSRLFTDLVLHIRMQIPCHRDPSLPLKIF
jgi:hypothetical protein